MRFDRAAWDQDCNGCTSQTLQVQPCLTFRSERVTQAAQRRRSKRRHSAGGSGVLHQAYSCPWTAGFIHGARKTLLAGLLVGPYG